MADALGTKGIDPQLALEAAAQMRRPAPGQEPDPKRRKQDAGDEVVPVLTRFAYNAGELLKQGCRGLLMTCHMRHERSAAKETLSVMQDYGCADGQFSTVKVACQGMVLIVLNEPGVQIATAPPSAANEQPGDDSNKAAEAAQSAQGASSSAAAASGGDEGGVPAGGGAADAAAAPAKVPAEHYPPFHLTLAAQRLIKDVADKKRPHTKVVHRIIPIERTSLLDPEALKQQVPHMAAAFKASPLAAKYEAMHARGEKIPFAVGFKNRDFNAHGSTWNGVMEGQTWEVYDKTARNATATATATDTDTATAAAAAPSQQDGEAKEADGAAQPAADAGGKSEKEREKSEKDERKKKDGADNAGSRLRQSVIHVLATSLQAALAPWELSVNLKEPELVMLCDVVPMAGGTFAALALVPAEMCKIRSTICLQAIWAGQ